MQFHNRLVEERARIGLTQTRMAQACGASLRSYAGYETGESEPKASTLSKMAEAGMDVSYLLTGKRSTIQDAAFCNMVTPRELSPLFDAWLHLFLSRTLTDEQIADWTRVVNHMNPALRAPSMKDAQARYDAANAELKAHQEALATAGTAGQAAPGVFKARRKADAS